MNLDFPGLEDVKKFVNQGDFTNAKAAYLDFRRTKSKAKWDINPSDKPQKAESPDYPRAEKIMKHLIPASDNAPEAFLGDSAMMCFSCVSDIHFLAFRVAVSDSYQVTFTISSKIYASVSIHYKIVVFIN
jgi:hypothetical protein